MYHVKPLGPGGVCNSTYLAIEEDPVDPSSLALRGNLYSGDLAKDNSDLAQSGKGGHKCPTTRIASGCNLIGNCNDYIPIGRKVVIQFEYMISNFHEGFDFW